MDEKIRIYGDISPKHEGDFLLIKGVFQCRNNGEAFEKLIDEVLPLARKKAARKSAN